MSALRTVSLTEEEWERVGIAVIERSRYWDNVAATPGMSISERQENMSRAKAYSRLYRAIHGAGA